MHRALINKLIDVLLPRQCVLCGMSSDTTKNLCYTCQSRLPSICNPCSHCGIDMQTLTASMLCATCINKPSAYQRCIALYRYEGGAQKLITEFKFKAKFAAGKFLAEELAEKINAHYAGKKTPDALLAIPAHYTRLARRGYNQSLLLAKGVARLTQIPLISNGLYKSKATPAQSSLKSAVARAQNLQNSFSVDPKLLTRRIESVAVIDDVVTTQATLNEAAKTLRAYGIKTVTCFCIARAN